MNISGVSQEEFARMQRVIDVDKWLASEAAGRDLCGTMDWCGLCVKAETHPCAKAKFRKQLQDALAEAEEEAAEEVAAEAAEEAAEKAAPDAQAAGTEGPDAEVSAILGEELAEECAAEDLAGERGAAAQNGQVLQDARPAPDGYEYVTRFRRSFASKIIQNEPAQDLYTEIKNAVLSYGGVKSRLCVGSENFRIGRQKIAKLAVAGKTLMLYLALDPKQFEDTAYRFEDMSDKRSHAATPLRVRLISRRAVRKAKELLDILARKFGLSPVGCIYTDFHYAYRSDEYLIGKGLIKPYRALVKKKN